MNIGMKLRLSESSTVANRAQRRKEKFSRSEDNCALPHYQKGLNGEARHHSAGSHFISPGVSRCNFKKSKKFK